MSGDSTKGNQIHHQVSFTLSSLVCFPHFVFCFAKHKNHHQTSDNINNQLMADPNRNRYLTPRNDSDEEDGEIRESDSEPPSKSKRHKNDEEVVLYCICRKPDTNRFMIGCDRCEEWYHGDCISITAEYAKKIRQFYCLSCREKEPGLEIVYNEKKPSKKKQSDRIDFSPDVKKKRYDDSGSDFEAELDSELKKKRTKFIVSDDEDDDDFEVKKKQTTSKQSKTKASQGKSRHSQSKSSRHRSSKVSSSRQISSRSSKRNRDKIQKEKDVPKQCFGPACIEAARKGSKYCSDACGIKLATNRIYEILPNRISQWQRNPSVADEINSKQLEKVRSEQLDARKQLEDLDVRQQELDDLIERSKKTIPFTEEEEEEYEEQMNPEGEADLSTYCVTCGHEVSNKMAVRHMERCFSKYEAQSSLGSVYKTKIDNLFCDFFNPQTKTYCKRLRILCPEHSKDPKIGDEEVCGFPLVTDVFKETNTFCRLHKKKCAKHHGWEKVRRALIDMERVQQWLRIDDLFEKEQKIRYSMSCRGGVLSLMLHQTIAAEEGASSPSSTFS